MAITKINKLPDDVVSTAKVDDNTIVNVDISPSNTIDQSKFSGLASSLQDASTNIGTVTTLVTSACSQNDNNYFNIALLGFKMAVNEGLTVFNLVDGVIDEFNDESGTDEAEGSNDNYCASNDFYDNINPSCAAQATTVVSEPFASGIADPTSSRIVVFQENVDTPTLNTDIIASVSRDGGTTFTAATLADSGYVTGASGQRILTGQATISGQPSGQSMRWKLALANNKVKIHGVSLSWA